MARQKIHENNAVKVRAGRLRRRARALENFYATILVTLYKQRGNDPGSQLNLPWLSYEDFEALGGPDIRTLPNDPLPYVELDRSGDHPMIRIGQKGAK